MNIQAQKLKLIEEIVQLNDEHKLNELAALIENFNLEKYNQDIEESEAEIERGEIFTQEEVKRIVTKKIKEKKQPKFGCLKDEKIYMSPDFDEPLEDFKDYM